MGGVNLQLRQSTFGGGGYGAMMLAVQWLVFVEGVGRSDDGDDCCCGFKVNVISMVVDFS